MPYFPTWQPGNSYTIGNLGTVAALTAADTLGATHGGADVQISVKNLEASLNTIYAGALTITSQPAANQIFQRATTTGGTTSGAAIAGVSLGAGLVSFGLNLSAAASTLQYQLVLASNNSTVLLPWTSFASSVLPGTQTFAISLPASLNWYAIQFRANSDSGSVVTSANPFAVGELVAFSGQSLALCFVSTLCSGDQSTIASLSGSIYQPATIGGTAITYTNGINPYCAVFAAYNWSNGGGLNNYNAGATATQAINWGTSGATPLTQWLQPTSASGGYSLASFNANPINSTFAVQFLNRLIAYWGVPCGLVGYAVGSTSIAQWQPGYSGSASNVPALNNYNALTAILNAAGGNFRALLWMQGHNDASGNPAVYNEGTISGGSPPTLYNQQFLNAYASVVTSGLVPLFAALSSAYPAFKTVLSSIPNYAQVGSASLHPIELVRQCYLAYATSVSAPYVDAHDIAMYVSGSSIGLHPSQVGCITLADHFFRAYMRAVGATPTTTHIGDQGPYISGASRSFGSANIGLTIAQPNSGTLTAIGTLASLFQVYPSGDPNNYGFSSANPGGTTPATYTVTGATIVNSGSINLTISPTPNDASSPVALDVYFDRPYDGTAELASAIYDGVVADGLPNGRLMWSMAPQPASPGAVARVTAAAPNPTIYNITTSSASTNPSQVFTVSGNYANGTPSSVAYYFTPNTTANAVAAGVGLSYSGGAFSFSVTAPSTVGSFVVVVIMTFASSATAQSTSGSFTTAANIITVGTPATQTISAGGTITSALTITGGWSIYAPTTLDYQTDLATWVTPASQTISGSGTIGTYSLVSTLGLYEGAYEIGVRDHNSLAAGYSNPFPVVNSGTLGNNYPLPVLSNAAWAPVFHFDASNPAGTLFQGASASSTNAVNGSPIGFFQDASGNAYSQATSAKQPTYKANVTNGMPGVLFVGTSGQNLEVVSNATFTALANALYNATNGGFTVFIVCKFNTPVPSGSANSNVLSWGQYSKNFFDHLDPLCIVPSGGNNYMVFTYAGGTSPGYQFFNANTVTSGSLYKWVARNIGGLTGTDYIEMQSVSNYGGTIYTGGTFSVGQTADSSYNYSMIGGSTESGSLGANSYAFDGYIHEILVYTEPLTSADGVALINYATAKWGS